MELNREEIVKALECLNDKHDRICDICPVYKHTERGYSSCRHIILDEAVALIKELAVELEAMRSAANSYKLHNGKLTEENEDLKAIAEQYRKQFEEAKADTVREMHSKIKERCIEGGIYPAFVARTIDQITKEMMEEMK